MKKIFKAFLALIFPFKCIKCLSFLYTDSAFCPTCWKSVEFISSPCCSLCSNPLQFSFNISKNLQHCASCYKDKPLFRQLVTVFKYTPEIKSIILNFKYNDKTQLAKPFGKLISEKLKSLENPKFDFITPVPLHSKKLRQRMYNQAALIAQNLSITFVADLLIREKDNSSQTNYTRIMRLKNIRGAFVINKKYKDLIKDKNILLIDDVITTGATINECCKILQKHHCSSITAATIAKRVLYS